MRRTFFIGFTNRKIPSDGKDLRARAGIMDIYCDQRSASHARIRFHSADTDDGIRGTIRGPFCKYARTLPTSFPIRDGQAIVVDPCYWTPRMPFRYEVTVSVASTSGKNDRQFLWGLRCCVPHKNNLYLDQKRYVVRAISAPEKDVDLSYLRELSCGLVVDTPTDDLCDAASEVGVMIIQTATLSSGSLRAASQHAAIHFALGESECDFNWTNVLPLSRILDDENSIIRMVDEQTATSGMHADRPIMVRRESLATQVSDLRRACDELQRDLAPYGQFVGYLVTASP